MLTVSIYRELINYAAAYIILYLRHIISKLYSAKLGILPYVRTERL